MKKKVLLLLLLLFVLSAVIFALPRLIRRHAVPGVLTADSRELAAETMKESSFSNETVRRETESEKESEEESEEPVGPGYPGSGTSGGTEREETEYDPGEPVEREKQPTSIIFASDMHYMSPSLTDYGKAFQELADDGDGKVECYMTQIWQAFADEVIALKPDALVLSGDLTLNGEWMNHEEFAARLGALKDAGITVLVIPGNHDINNPYATSYFGDEQSFIESVTAREFREIYGPFGYDGAVSYVPDSLSYLYMLNETTWMLMLDTCIYDPVNEVGGRISEDTLEWLELCLQSAYFQGITVIPAGHHNLQELSRVFVEECVIRNYDEVTGVLERYLTPLYFSGHLHVQRILKHRKEPGTPDSTYGIWEIVSNSLIIPPCQYGYLTCNVDGSFSYQTRNVDVSGWAAAHGETNGDLLDFEAFSEAYLRRIIKQQTYKKIDGLPEEISEELADFYAELYRNYCAGGRVNYSEKKKEPGYKLWDRFMNPSMQFRQVEGMMKDGMEENNYAEIPNPIYLNRE